MVRRSKLSGLSEYNNNRASGGGEGSFHYNFVRTVEVAVFVPCTPGIWVNAEELINSTAGTESQIYCCKTWRSTSLFTNDINLC